MKKMILTVVLLIMVALGGYLLYDVISAPIKFNDAVNARTKDVVEKIKDIRTAQRAYRKEKGHFAPSFDSLIYFVKNDSMVFEIKMGSADDSVAIKEGRVKTVKNYVSAMDTLFGHKNINIDELSIIPHSNGKKFKMAATIIETGNQNIKVPVFCATAEYKTYLESLDDKQALINMYDYDETLGVYPGIKVGSLEKPTNEAGNWED